MSLVDDLAARVMPLLHGARDALAAAWPRHRFQVGTHPIGGLTDYQGHEIYLVCLFTDGRDPDSLQLTVNLAYLTSAPRLLLDVVWGSGDVEASLPEVWDRSSNWPLADAEAVAEVLRALPRLLGVFEDAVRRGYPIPPEAS
jgi:hypothetical protein